MNRRINLIASALVMLLMVALLVPLAQMMTVTRDRTLDEKQAAAAHAIELQQEHDKLSPALAVEAAGDIEAVWAIEDARGETDEQLVHSMFCGADEMGYDAESRTFYATLGPDLSDEWPEIALSARGADGVQVIWVDDYSYDWCADAVAEGYRYELMAYTDTAYAYIGVVFTGLPIVALHTDAAITMDGETAGWASIAAAGYEPVESALVVHERGGGYTEDGVKKSYRLEFHELGDNGKDHKRDISVLGMELDSDWLLLANDGDRTSVRNKLAWDIWRDWHGGEPALMIMDSEMVEVFVNDRYMGLYQMMERVQETREIEYAGGNPDMDSVVRFISSFNPSRRPVWDLEEEMDITIEYRYAPYGNERRAFSLAEDYTRLCRMDEQKLDDEAFAALALERMDIGAMMNYLLFFHACTLSDNNTNNVYLYSLRREDGTYAYHPAPWDLDSSFWVYNSEDSHNTLRWPDLTMTVPVRMLELNVGGCREILWDLWNEKRTTVLSQQSLSERFMAMETFINASGAYLRESERWRGEAEKLNLSEIEYYTEECLNLVRLTMESTWPVEGGALEP